MTVIPGAVVVGIDGSPDSDRGLRWAIAAAVSRRAPLCVLCAVPDAPYDFPIPRDMDVERRARMNALLAAARAQALRAGCAEITTSSVDGAPGPALQAAGRRAAMIVVGALGHGAIGGMLLGSVSGYLSRHASCPVVVVREQADPAAQRVVVGVDGWSGGEKAINFGFDVASRQQVPLVAVHAWHYPRVDFRASLRSLDEVAEDVRAQEQWLDGTLARWAEKYPDVEVTCEAIQADHSADVLVNASEHAALVVVGPLGRDGLVPLPLGTVTQAVLHRARCPVAVAR